MLYCSTVSLLGLFFPEGGFFCSIAGIICLPKEGLFVPFLGLFFPKEVFFVPFLGLFCSRRMVSCPIAGIICLSKEGFLSLSPRRFLFYNQDSLSPKGGFFCPIAGIFCLPKEVFLLHCWDCLSPKEVILPIAFYLPKEVVFLKEQLFKSLKRSRNVKHWTWSH